MRVSFNSQFKDELRAIKEHICKSERLTSKTKYVELNGYRYKIDRVAFVICSTEIISCFLSESLGKSHLQVEDILQFFRISTNSDIPYFESFDKNKAAKLHSTLHYWSYKNSIDQTLAEYRRYRKEWKIFKHEKIDKFIYLYSIKNDSLSKKRKDMYSEALKRQLEHEKHRMSYENMAGAELEASFCNNVFYYYDNLSNRERCIILSNNQISFAKANFSPYTIDITPRSKQEIEINRKNIIEWSNKMDELDRENGANHNWNSRVKDLVFSIPGPLGLDNEDTLRINGLIHAVGALSVGKSTFISVCAFGLAEKKKRVVIFLNTISDVYKMTDYLNKLKVKAVPLLSKRLVHHHANQYLSSLKSHNEMFEDRESLKYLNDICMLLNSNIDLESKINDSTSTPCSSLYVKNVSDENDSEDFQKVLCPFISICPRYNDIRNLNEAQVIITTINSAVQSILPMPFTSRKMKILEYIIRTCDIAFVDESDQVQASLDSMFCSELNIYGFKDLFNKYSKDRIIEYQESGEVPDNNHILDFMRGLSNIEYITANIVSFLSTAPYIDNLFKNKDLFENIVKSSTLWREMFDEAIGINRRIIGKEIKNDDKKMSLYIKARNAFGFAFEKFQKDLLANDGSFSKDQLTYNMRTIASNLADENKLTSDLEKFSKTKLNKLFRWEAGPPLRKDQFVELTGLYENWDKPLEDILKFSVQKLRFIIELYMLEHKIKFVLEKWELISSIDRRLTGGKNSYPGALKHEFAGIVPTLPMDINYGFRFDKDSADRIRVKYINFEGIGRWILLNFDKLYRDIDGIGINCILLSGTSNMKTSPKYNIDIPVGCLLRKPGVTKPTLHMYYPASIVSKVSGMHSDSLNLSLLADNLFNNQLMPDGIAYLPKVFNRLSNGRKRVLFSLGSYDECRQFSKRLNTYMDNKSYNLVRPGEKQSETEIERSKIEDIAKYDIKSLSIPLRMGRGYNIITVLSEFCDLIDGNPIEAKCKTVAAMGAAFFNKRPFYVPNDIQTMVSWLNCIYFKTVRAYKDGKIPDIIEFRRQLIGGLHREKNDFENIYGYSSFSDEQRKKLLGDTLVDIYQLACRLIRGDVDAEIHFLDSSFAPNTVSTAGDYDSEKTSMLIGWRQLLNEMIICSSEQSTKEIYEELYQILLNGLNEISIRERSVINNAKIKTKRKKVK